MPDHGTLSDHARLGPEMLSARFGRSRFQIALYRGQPMVEPTIGLIALDCLAAVGWPVAANEIAIMLPDGPWPAWRTAQQTVQAIFAADDPMIQGWSRQISLLVNSLVHSVFGHIARFAMRYPDSEYHALFNPQHTRVRQISSVVQAIISLPHVRANDFAADLIAQYILRGEIAFRRPVLDPPTAIGPQIDRNLLALYRFDPVLSEFLDSALRCEFTSVSGRSRMLAARKAELTTIFHSFAARADLLRPSATDRLDDILNRFTDRLNDLCDALLTSCVGQAIIVRRSVNYRDPEEVAASKT